MTVASFADRTASRLARIKGDVPVMRVESAPVPHEIAEAAKPAQAQMTRQLGPNQLAWLRAEVPAFAVCERQALEAENHKQKLAEAVRA
jgi:hypothetical protein